MPAYLLLGNTLTTTSFEPLSWTLAIYVRDSHRRAPSRRMRVGFGRCSAARGRVRRVCESTRWRCWSARSPSACSQRRDRAAISLRAYAAWRAPSLALALLAPNLAWQASHGWPFFAVIRGDASHRPAFRTALRSSTGAFAAMQSRFRSNNCSIRIRSRRRSGWPASSRRFVSRAARSALYRRRVYRRSSSLPRRSARRAITSSASMRRSSRIGAVAIERAAVALRVRLTAALLRSSQSLRFRFRCRCCRCRALSLTRRLCIYGAPGRSPTLQPVVCRRVWLAAARARRRTRSTSRFRPVRALERRSTPTPTAMPARSTSSDRSYGLPPAISSQNSYYLWGTRGYDGTTLVAIGATRIDRFGATIAASSSFALRPNRTNGSSKGPRRSIFAATRRAAPRDLAGICAGTARRSWTMVSDHGIIRGGGGYVETIAISKFKATCLAVLERVRKTQKPVLVTRFGAPVAEIIPPRTRKAGADWLGALAGLGTIRGDIVGPATDADDWEVLGS